MRPGALVWQPPPPAAGDVARARRLARGVLFFDGRLVETEAPVPWDIEPPDAVWSDTLHGHGWLDDAAAADDRQLWAQLEAWVWAWIERYGGGAGPGWRADLVARRLTRWIAHSVRLLRGQPPGRSRLFFRALAGHARYLAWRWREAEGAARIEALGGLVYASLSLEGTASGAAAIRHLGSEADRLIGPDGAIESRNPEELARILSILAWSAETIAEAGRQPAEGHTDAMRRAAPVVRALRMAGGGLARFHGGRGAAGLDLDGLTAGAPAAPLPPGPGDPRAMGYLRLSGGEAVLILDAAPPPSGRHAATAHASTLAFEFGVGAQPVIVGSGPGLAFGEREAAAARRAGAHSTVIVGDTRPATLRTAGGRALLGTTGSVGVRVRREQDGSAALAESTLYADRLGLVLERRIFLSRDGTRLAGEDTVLATTAAMRERAAALYPPGGPPCPVAARFHLHPDIRARIVLSGRGVALTLPDGARWLMRTGAELALEPGLYYDETRAKPRPTMQIVASTALADYWGQIEWTLERVGEGLHRPRAGRAAAASGAGRGGDDR